MRSATWTATDSSTSSWQRPRDAARSIAISAIGASRTSRRALESARCDRHSTGAAFADVDGDGDLDLVLLATNGPNAIFLNDGHGAFTEHRDLGLDSTGRGGTTLTMADVDGDGRLDLYVANYRHYSLEDSLPPQQRAFNQMVRQVAPGRYEIVPEFAKEYKLVMRPDMGGLKMSMRGDPDEFYRNDGAGRFSRVPFTSDRFKDANGQPSHRGPGVVRARREVRRPEWRRLRRTSTSAMISRTWISCG